MTYEAAVEFLGSLVDFERLGFHRHFAETVGLDSARRFLGLLGDPHHATPAVHIAGTKGKGSTAAMVERALREAGYRTGLFTSPHLVSFHERVRVNGVPIDREAVAAFVDLVQPAFGQVRETPGLTPCTFFEAYLGMAALHFQRERVDIAIYETGLGGRLDATNLLAPVVCAVTTIGFDHTAILGDTLDAIAREKAEIAKPGVPLVVARAQAEEALRAIHETAQTNGAPVVAGPPVTRRVPPCPAGIAPDGAVVRPCDMFEVQPAAAAPFALTSPLVGAHQAINVGVALGVLAELGHRGYTVDAATVARALREVRWPGRFDVRGARPWLVFDCAHNPESARALARTLPEYLTYDRLVAVVGMAEDKDTAGFARELGPAATHTVLTRAAIDRALAPEEMLRRSVGAWAGAECIPTIPEACRRARELAGPTGAICIAGSFYVVGEALQALGMEP